MDFSSDSDEFYECDDADEDVPIPKDCKEAVPVTDVSRKQMNTDSKETVNIVSSDETKTTVLTNSETSNNNIHTKNEQKNLTKHIAKEAETVKNNNVSTDIDNLQVEELNRLDLDEEYKEKCSITPTKEKKTMILDQVDCERAITSTNSTTYEKSTVETNLVNNSEDLWGGGDNWGEMNSELSEETNPTPRCPPEENLEDRKSESVPDNKATIKETSMPKKSIKSQPNLPEADENLWNDEDDWGALETKPYNQEEVPEEDLWGDGDGWGLDTPQETPKRSTANVSNESQPKSGDVWTESDNWGLDETKETTKNKTPTATDAKSALNALTKEESPSWGGWGSWNISTVLSTAANITTSVSQGITTVLESGIGVPDPEELARIHKAEEESRRQSGEEGRKNEENFVPFALGNFVPGVSTITKLVETTGTKVITKGLGTLETIGKKTYEVLQENDPQLKKKRALLKYLEGEKPVLSSILREAKERAETENKDRERRHFAKKANYETMFDDYTGLVHLEALEMLSKQCDYKLETILSQSGDVTEMQETMEQIKDLCELTVDDDDEEADFDEMKSKMSTAIEEINIGISCEKILDSYGEVLRWIGAISLDNTTPEEVHSNAIENLAKITAMSVEQYHKAAELLLIKEHRSTADEADSLVQLTNAISALIGVLSTKYTEKLKDFTAQASNDEIKTLISNIYLEAANSSRYVEDAFGLLIPVIQVGAV